MWGSGYAMGWGMWLLMGLGTVSFWILVAVAVWALMRGPVRQQASEPDPVALLDERLARGEIDAVEYQYRRRLLVEGHPQDQPHRASDSDAGSRSGT